MPKTSPRCSVSEAGPRCSGAKACSSRIASPACTRAAWIEILQRPPHHQADNLADRRPARLPFAGIAAVAQHDETVRHLHHLFDEMRDVDDGETPLLEARDELEQLLHVGTREAAGRLVQHQHAATGHQRASNLDKLLRGRRQLAGAGLDGKFRMSELVEGGPCGAADTIAVDEAECTQHIRPWRLGAKRDVVHHAQVRRQRELLIDHRHPGVSRVARTTRGVRRSGQHHRAGIGRRRTGEHRHQRALAGAVLPDQRAHFARMHREVDTIERNGAAKRLANAAHFEPRNCGLRHPLPVISFQFSVFSSQLSVFSGFSTEN